MESQAVIQIESPQQVLGAWPRLLTIIAIATLVFCAVQLLGIAQSFYIMFTQRAALGSRQVSWPDYVGIRTLLSVADAIVNVIMAGAAATVWKRGRGITVLRACLWLWFGITAAGIAQYLFFISWNAQSLANTAQFFANFTLQGLVVGSFPALALLILREYTGHVGLPRNPLRLFVRWLID